MHIRLHRPEPVYQLVLYVFTIVIQWNHLMYRDDVRASKSFRTCRLRRVEQPVEWLSSTPNRRR
jgi:hypothetical protein